MGIKIGIAASVLVALLASLYFNYNLTGTLEKERAEALADFETYKDNESKYEGIIAEWKAGFDELRVEHQRQERQLLAIEETRRQLERKLAAERTAIATALNEDDSCRNFAEHHMCSAFYNLVRFPSEAAGDSGAGTESGENMPFPAVPAGDGTGVRGGRHRGSAPSGVLDPAERGRGSHFADRPTARVVG